MNWKKRGNDKLDSLIAGSARIKEPEVRKEESVPRVRRFAPSMALAMSAAVAAVVAAGATGIVLAENRNANAGAPDGTETGIPGEAATINVAENVTGQSGAHFTANEVRFEDEWFYIDADIDFHNVKMNKNIFATSGSVSFAKLEFLSLSNDFILVENGDSYLVSASGNHLEFPFHVTGEYPNPLTFQISSFPFSNTIFSY